MPKPNVEFIDLYWSFRSPYSYLALKPILALQARRNVVFRPKIVLPLAVRDKTFFSSRGHAWVMYLLQDVFRLGEMTGQIIRPPNPDPIVQDMATQIVAEKQPYIWRLSRLGLLSAETEHGLSFLSEVSQLIWSGEDWTAGTALADAAQRAGLDLAKLDAAAEQQAAELDKRLIQHDKDLRAAGHWGVPTCVLRGEAFFGMDRLDVLEWRLDQLGIS